MKTPFHFIFISVLFLICDVSSTSSQHDGLRSKGSSSSVDDNNEIMVEDKWWPHWHWGKHGKKPVTPPVPSSNSTDHDKKKKKPVTPPDDKKKSGWWPHWHWGHKDDPHKKKVIPPKKQTCEMQGNCTSCLLHSSMCQWCDSSTSCHHVLSWHGCWHSAKCYTNKKCHREIPEPARDYPRKIPHWVTTILTAFSLVLFGFLTCTYASVSSFHHAYQDILNIRNKNNENETTETSDENNKKDDKQDQTNTKTNNLQSPQWANATSSPLDQCEENHDEMTQPLLLEDQPFIDDQNKEEEGGYHLDENKNNDELTGDEAAKKKKKRRMTSRGKNCLFGMCTLLYVLAVVFILFFSSFVVWIFPQMPQLNICSDEFAWKSIIESVENMQLQASFGILMSVHNPNRFALSMKNFNGKFHHNGNEIGSYKIESTTFAAMSITDVTMTCSFSPEKWEAVKLAADYYRGNLVLQVNAQGTIQLSQNVAIPINMGDMSVNATNYNMDDRHLCACPKWSDAKKQYEESHPSLLTYSETE